MMRTDAERIRDALSEGGQAKLDLVEIFPEIESTNSYLLNQAAPIPGQWRIAMADHQTAGRGRLRNQWFSPPLSGLYLSAAYTFKRRPGMLSCLTLAVGAAVASAMGELGVQPVLLKWPNDLVLNDGKLGGILTEMKSGASGSATVIIGIGINIDMGQVTDGLGTAIGRVADMKEVLAILPERAVIATRVIESLMTMVSRFEIGGFASIASDWNRLDWLKGRDIAVDSPGRRVVGRADGIDADGALRVRTDDDVARVTSGTIELARAVGE